MKLVHAADLHLDSALLGLERYEGAPVHRIRRATRGAFENLVRLCIDERAALLLLAGDLYDEDWKDYSSGLFFHARMVELRDAGVRVVWLRGNHDAASQISKHLDPPDNVHELPWKKPGSVPFDDLNLVVHGQGFVARDVRDNLALGYPAPVPGLFNIGLLHTSVSGRAGHEPYAPCSVSDLVHKGYDYWALGHVHRAEVLSRDPWIVFPGNLQGRHVRETGAKGATLVEVADGRVLSADPRALDVVRWAVCQIDATGAPTADEVLARIGRALGDELGRADGRLLCARVVVEGATAAHGALTERREQFVAAVQALANQTGGEELWVEQVRFATRAELDLGELRQRDDAIGQVFRGLSELRATPEGREEVAAELAALLAKLPSSLTAGPMALDWKSPAELDRLLDDVEQLLLPRLAGGGER